jgi:hypothetical protein
MSPDDYVGAIAFNAISPAVDQYNADRQPRLTSEPYFLPLSLRMAIAESVVEALRVAGQVTR